MCMRIMSLRSEQLQDQRLKKQVRSFMGLAGYYRDFIPNFAAIAAILSDLTRKVQPSKVEWGDTHEKAYQTIKILLTIDPILRLPDPEKTFVLRTDALDYGIGAVLIQEHEGKLFLICYASKKLSDAEGNYSTIEKECLAVVGYQEISCVSIWCALCTTDGSRASYVYEQSKVH